MRRKRHNLMVSMTKMHHLNLSMLPYSLDVTSIEILVHIPQELSSKKNNCLQNTSPQRKQLPLFRIKMPDSIESIT